MSFAATVRQVLRMPLLIACLLGGLAIAATVLGRLRPGGRERVVRTWARATLRACGVRLAVPDPDGAGRLSAPGGRLVLANHLSWLDILAIDAIAPCRFVAKAEILGWPLIGLLCERAGTIFIERGRRHAVHAVIGVVVDALRSGERVAVFPEGTTGDGTSVLPFHANIAEAAVRAGCPVLPLALRYEDARGERSRAVEFIGDTTFAASLLRVLGEPRTTAVLRPLEPVAPGGTRHELARAAEAAVRGELFPGTATSPAAAASAAGAAPDAATPGATTVADAEAPAAADASVVAAEA